MKNLKAIGALLILAVSIVACNDDDFDNTPELQAIGDVFVRCKKSGDDLVYAPIFYTYSNFAMKTVSVEGPTDSNIDTDLGEYTSKMIYRLMPGENNFSTDDVMNGSYEFEITAEDLQVYTISDKLLESRLEPANITEFNYNSTLHSIEISWDEVEDADVYVIKIHNQVDGDLIYSSQRTAATSYRVLPGSSEWTDFNTVDGATYVAGVYAYKFESANATSGYDINCESVTYQEIEW